MLDKPKERHAKINFVNTFGSPAVGLPSGAAPVTFVRDTQGNIRAYVDDIASIGGGGPGYAGVIPVTPPDFADFSTNGSAPAGQVTEHDPGRYSAIQLQSNETSQTWYRTIPSTPYAIRCAVSVAGNAVVGSQFVLDQLDSSLVVVRQTRLIFVGATWRIRISTNAVDLLTFDTGLTEKYSGAFYLKIVDDGSTWFFQFSPNGGWTWRTLFSEARGSTVANYGFRATSIILDAFGCVIWTLSVT